MVKMLTFDQLENFDISGKSEYSVTYTQEEVEEKKYNNLWLAVLIQAVTDAKTNYKRKENKMEKAKSLSWLLDDENKELDYVCELAGYPAKKTRYMVKRYLSSIGAKTKSDNKGNNKSILVKKHSNVKSIFPSCQQYNSSVQ